MAECTAPPMAGRTVGEWAWTSSSCPLESGHCLRGHRGAGLEEAEAESRRGPLGARGCAAWGPWMARCPRGAGWDTSPPPGISDKVAGSAAPATAPRLQSCGGGRASVASSAVSPSFPASRPACAWVPAGRAGPMRVGVLRCCPIAVSETCVCGKNK